MAALSLALAQFLVLQVLYRLGESAKCGPHCTTEAGGVESYNTVDVTGCGSDTGCLFYSSGDSRFLLTYRYLPPSQDGPRILINVEGKADGYVAVGLSKDNKMGDDEVYACCLDGGAAHLKTYKNQEGYGGPVLQAVQPVDVNRIDYADGVLNCEIVRHNGKRGTLINQTEGIYFILAYGPYQANSQSLLKHSITPHVSSKLVQPGTYIYEDCNSGSCESLTDGATTPLSTTYIMWLVVVLASVLISH